MAALCESTELCVGRRRRPQEHCLPLSTSWQEAAAKMLLLPVLRVHWGGICLGTEGSGEMWRRPGFPSTPYTSHCGSAGQWGTCAISVFQLQQVPLLSSLPQCLPPHCLVTDNIPSQDTYSTSKSQKSGWGCLSALERKGLRKSPRIIFFHPSLTAVLSG
ncbi:hypothetical protein KIL84_019785 [Mauremys mutica]|uniref:Uncharacterized protein n=1 Tax=Mauremys mutica TaxID=74926 RepID=A0A9D4BAL5_9SAUR|nr:hypothetical protein KIL84_019785 [Mauremys mutica]